MPFCFNWKISRLCQTLFKDLDMSKETLLTFNPLSKVFIPQNLFIDGNCLVSIDFT